MLKIYTIILYIILEVSTHNSPWKDVPIRWVDDVVRKGGLDIFYDRLVAIIYHFGLAENETNSDYFMGDHQAIAPGVIISENQILTSFNPFKYLIRNKTERQNIIIAAISRREITVYRHTHEVDVTYTCLYYSIACARQVMPIADSEITELKAWHGFGGRRMSPLHDLMVIRLNDTVTFQTPSNAQYYMKRINRSLLAGPIKTFVADKTHNLTREIRFASLGFYSEYDMWRFSYLHYYNLPTYHNMITSCLQWFPKNWGYFICVKNSFGFRGLGSAAMLFHHDVLVGVGSFALMKGTEGVLVFTDVREYHDVIFPTCTVEDQNLYG